MVSRLRWENRIQNGSLLARQVSSGPNLIGGEMTQLWSNRSMA